MSEPIDDPHHIIETYERRLDACSAKVEERVHDLEDASEPEVRRAAVEDISLLTHAIATIRLELTQLRDFLAIRLQAHQN